MNKLAFALIFTFASTLFAQNETWIKKDQLLIPAESINQVDNLTTPDGELSLKVITIDRADGLYDVALSFGGVLEQQTYVAVGYTSTAGDYSLQKNKDGSYQLKMLLGTITGKDASGEPTFGYTNISLKVVVDRDARVTELK